MVEQKQIEKMVTVVYNMYQSSLASGDIDMANEWHKKYVELNNQLIALLMK